MQQQSVCHRDVWPYVGCIRCATQDNGKFHVYSGYYDGNRVGMMLRMSCARRGASCDRIEVAGILTNDGRGCGGREKFSVANGKSRMVGREKNLVANG